MNRIILIIFSALLVVQSCGPSGEVFENAVCIQNITTIDPQEGARVNQTVILRDGKIFRIAPTAELKLSPTNTIIDGTGKFLIPGLWDAHIHFAYIPSLAPRMFDLFLLYGITSVRDTGGELNFVSHWRENSRANPTDAPRVMIAGPLLDGVPTVYDGSPGHPPLAAGSATIEQIVRKVEVLDSAKVDFLKAYEMLTPEQFNKIMELAKAKGYRVTGHVPLSMDVITASNAGLGGMEHMRNLEISCASNADELLAMRGKMLKEGQNAPGGELRSGIHAAQREIAIKNYDENKANEILQVLLKNQTWQTPTLALNTSQTRLPYNRPEWQESFSYIPDSISSEWMSIIEQAAVAKLPPFRQQYSDWMLMMAKKVYDTGIPMMAGTDTPIAFLTPGMSLHEELVVMSEAGIPNQEILKTATINPAKYFQLDNELGSIKEGFWADLLIVDANPLDNIRNTQRISAVFKQGKFYGPAEREAIRKRLRGQ